MAKTDEAWEIDSAVDTLIRAHEILNDKKLLPKVEKAFAEKMKALYDAALELKVADKQALLREKSK